MLEKASISLNRGLNFPGNVLKKPRYVYKSLHFFEIEFKKPKNLSKLPKLM
jgi:hypothetical protein